MKKPIALAISAVALAAATLAGTAAIGTEAAAASRLRSFGTCANLLGYAKRHAMRMVGPWGLGGYAGLALPVAEAAGTTAAPAPAEARDAVPGVDYSTTNVQEAGVDEPDIVKTDGARLFAIAQGKLHAVDVTGPEPRLLGSLRLEEGWNHQLLLAGNRVLVVSGAGEAIRPLPAMVDGYAPFIPPTAVLAEVDVSDPAAMRLVRTLSVEGTYLNARLVGSTVRVVLSSPPAGIEFAYPQAAGLTAEAAAERRNRRAIATSTLKNWVPRYTLENRATRRTRKGAVLDCQDVRHPQQFSGLGLLTVLTIDLDRGLQPIDSDAVMTAGDIVYASTGSLYVATQRWVDWAARSQSGDVPQGMTTILHKFDISSEDGTEYRASGEVPGFLLSQWSMSEHEGHLRVASTDVPTWWTEGPPRENESFVSVLEEQGSKLVKIGRVGDLGRGEQIYAVRFIGDVGYVVTFRQTDPLYTIDLSNPERPAVLGELKILGYSAYLHPIGDDLLLGIGQDATEEGRALGTQLSVFDVSDLAKPTRLHQLKLGQAWSEAESDHHAFLYWPATGLTVVPVQSYSLDEITGQESWFAGAIGARVGRARGIEQIGTIPHPQGDLIRRSLVVGDALYTVSEQGVEASGLGTLAKRAWLSFT